ncbi:hypothetical protein HK100_008538 [Physocladia obscura]|uniref:DUF2855 family protein n=1 Tax=Physocladia obscura TaxID=109957 RepID=A0AAD5SP28_9FUNG|nr:hypothetical protein HK100_008538 [Physocladia obscura]
MSFLEINRKDPRIVQVCPLHLTAHPLAVNTIRVRIDKFGVSANNITYVALGDSFQYSKFFPTKDTQITHQMPVWGLATVVESKHPRVPVSVRFFGYLPAASHCDLNVERVDSTSFKVSRPQLPADRAVYNHYEFCTTDPLYNPATENAMILFRPVWFTSFYLNDYVQYHKCFGASTILVSSASSKTSFCFAQLARVSDPSVRVVALTSPRNAAWVSSLGVYTDTILYDDIPTSSLLSPHSTEENNRVVYVDVAGDFALLNRVVSALGGSQNLAKCIEVGASHYDPANTPIISEHGDNNHSSSDGPKINRELFFMPSWILKRKSEVGMTVLTKDVEKGWAMMLRDSSKWIQFREFNGNDAAKAVYLDMLEARALPDIGYIVRMDANVFDNESKL